MLLSYIYLYFVPVTRVYMNVMYVCTRHSTKNSFFSSKIFHSFERVASLNIAIQFSSSKIFIKIFIIQKHVAKGQQFQSSEI